MRINNFLSVLMFQLNMTLDCNSSDEYLIETDSIKEGVNTKRNLTHILSLSQTRAQYVYGEFIVPEILSRFGRSDSYINNPRNIVVSNL